MKTLKLSYVLILVALGLGLNAQNLNANDPSQDQKQKRALSPSIQHQNEDPNKHAQPAQNIPAPINKNPDSAIQKNSASDKSQYVEDRLWPKEIGTWADVAMAVVTFLAVLVAASTLRSLNAQVEVNRLSAEAALKTASYMTDSERAYIKISHQKPGLALNISRADVIYGSGPYKCTVNFNIQNIGKTPARITSLVYTPALLLKGQTLPKEPPYAPDDRPPIDTILYAKDETFPVAVFDMMVQDCEAIHKGDKEFYLLAYADYIDHFRNRHRAGYARLFDPKASENNLLVVPQPGYNYDRPRKPGEGHDWNEHI